MALTSLSIQPTFNNYSKNIVQVLSVEAGALSQESGRIVNPNPILQTIDSINGRVSVDMLINAGTPRKGLWGSGGMVKIQMRALSTGTADIIFKSDSIIVRDTTNKIISLSQLINGKVVVK